MTKPTYRVGPKMLQALAVVSYQPGIVQQQAAIAIGPHKAHAYGCRILQRCYDAGLIAFTREKGPTGAWGKRLTLTPYGEVVRRADGLFRIDILEFQSEATQAGDEAMVKLCEAAINGPVDGRYWQRATQAIAQAQTDAENAESAARGIQESAQDMVAYAETQAWEA